MIIQQLKRDPSSFQQALDETALVSSLSDQLSGELIHQVVELSAGMFNNTYKVDCADSSYILKVAPVPDAEVFYNERNLMRRERTVSGQLQSLSDLVPEYLSWFSIDGRDAFLQSYVEGDLWHDVTNSLSESENDCLWMQLGAFAKKLHQCNGGSFGYPGSDRDFDKWSDFIRDNVEGMVEDCHRLGVFSDEIAQYLESFSSNLQLLDDVDRPGLCHGDIWPRNVIINGRGEGIHISAVIDAERAFWGDPVSDWVLILFGVPDAFWKGYGENLLNSSDPRRIALYKGMYFILNILESTRTGDPVSRPREWLASVNTALQQG